MIDRSVIQKLAKATNGELYSLDVDPFGVEYGWMYQPVETQDALEDFEKASANYRECSKSERGTVAGFPVLSFSCVQVKKGDQREPLSIIDVGYERLCFRYDLSEFFN
jgi:hypothetical protein